MLLCLELYLTKKKNMVESFLLLSSRSDFLWRRKKPLLYVFHTEGRCCFYLGGSSCIDLNDSNNGETFRVGRSPGLCKSSSNFGLVGGGCLLLFRDGPNLTQTYRIDRGPWGLTNLAVRMDK